MPKICCIPYPNNIMTKIVKICYNRYSIYDQNGWKTIPFGPARTYLAHIREHPPPLKKNTSVDIVISIGNRTESNSVCNHTSDNQIRRPHGGRSDLLIMSMITDRIGRHKVLLPINQNYNSKKRRIAKLWKKGKICSKIPTKEMKTF